MRYRIRRRSTRNDLQQTSVAPLDFKVRNPVNMLIRRTHNNVNTQVYRRRARTQQLLSITDSDCWIVVLPIAYPPYTTKYYYPNE